MKHTGKARRAGFKIILYGLLALGLILGIGVVSALLSSLIAVFSPVLVLAWVLFAAATLYFFRDPDPHPPLGPGVVLAPAHGKVDLIEETIEPQFIGGACRRISTALSLWDVHVQKAPVAGRVLSLQSTPGEFGSTKNPAAAAHNENALIGIDSSEQPGEKFAVRLVAGSLTRRLVPWVAVGEQIQRGERISMIQYGSRCDFYMPLNYAPRVRLGDRVVGGETIIAFREEAPAPAADAPAAPSVPTTHSKRSL
jgi:phosphatidylserine decarboxylase